ncbi:MAG: hypothetical protein RLZZ375_1570, partial [Pseudomonadota bacterium]
SRLQLRLQTVGEVTELSSVWRIAQQAADARKMAYFGVLVFRTSPDNFGVVISSDSLEDLYTQAVCQP